MKSRIQLLLWIALISLVLTTSLFWVFERSANADVNCFFDVIWWWVVTSGTVGYGDIAPVTWQGRVVAIFAIITGFFIFANLIAIIAESIHAFAERRSRGTAQVEAKGHIVLCEYTAITDEFIQSIPAFPEFSKRDVVIVSDLVTRNPYPKHMFVRGVPINPASLSRASVSEADYVFIFANLRFADPDVKTMHIASRVIELNPEAHIFIELVDPDNELMDYMPDKVSAMNSRSLIESVLKDKKIDLNMFIDKAGVDDSNV